MSVHYIQGFLGGSLIGLAAVLLFWMNGRIMGVSGIASNMLAKPSKETGWRLAFLAGLILGGWIWKQNFPVEVVIDSSWTILILAGILVGFGTVTGSGCTSGHGICGIARFSKRSIIATVIFMSTGIFTVWLRKLWGS